MRVDEASQTLHAIAIDDEIGRFFDEPSPECGGEAARAA